MHACMHAMLRKLQEASTLRSAGLRYTSADLACDMCQGSPCSGALLHLMRDGASAVLTYTDPGARTHSATLSCSDMQVIRPMLQHANVEALHSRNAVVSSPQMLSLQCCHATSPEHCLSRACEVQVVHHDEHAEHQQGCAAVAGSPNSCCMASTHALPDGSGSRLRLRFSPSQQPAAPPEEDRVAGLLADRHAPCHCQLLSVLPAPCALSPAKAHRTFILQQIKQREVVGGLYVIPHLVGMPWNE